MSGPDNFITYEEIHKSILTTIVVNDIMSMTKKVVTN